MNKGENPALGDGLLDLGGAEHGLASLVGKGQSGKGGIGEKPVDLGRQPFGYLGFRLERPLEDVALSGVGDLIVRRGQPYPPARQLFLDIRDDHAVGAEHEADQLVLGPAGTRQSAAADATRLFILLAFLLRRRLPQTSNLLPGSSVACAEGSLVPRGGAGIGSRAAFALAVLRLRSKCGFLDPPRLDAGSEAQTVGLLPAQA